MNWISGAQRKLADTTAPFRVGETVVDPLDWLRSQLLMQGAHALQAVEIARRYASETASAPNTHHAVRTIRQRLYQLKLAWRRWRTQIPSPSAVASADVVVIPRLPVNMTDLQPVARHLRDVYGHRPLILTHRAVVAESAMAANLPWLDANRFRAPNSRRRFRDAYRYVRAISAAFARMAPIEGPALPGDREALKAAWDAVVRELWPPLVFEAELIDFLLETCRPKLVLVGNPITMEGRAAVALARSRGLATASMEHGTIYADDPQWRELPLSRMCVWGACSQDALRANGVADSQIAITGAPRLDEVIQRMATPPHPPRDCILVAVSGAGHMIDVVRHRRFIATMIAAAQQTPEIRWVVKLHPKDSADFYLPELQRAEVANVEIFANRPHASRPDIFDFLRRAFALVTVTSTTALDAMIADVPVITVEAELPRPTGLAFLDQDVTCHVRSVAELIAAVRRFWGVEACPVEWLATQRAYRDRHFAYLGTATATTAAELHALAQ